MKKEKEAIDELKNLIRSEYFEDPEKHTAYARDLVEITIDAFCAGVSRGKDKILEACQDGKVKMTEKNISHIYLNPKEKNIKNQYSDIFLELLKTDGPITEDLISELRVLKYGGAESAYKAVMNGAVERNMKAGLGFDPRVRIISKIIGLDMDVCKARYARKAAELYEKTFGAEEMKKYRDAEERVRKR